MAAARFVVVSDDDVNAFSKQQENEITKKKTLWFKDFQRISRNLRREKRNREYYLCATSRNRQKVCACCSQKNGDEYEPSSIRAFLQSIDRYLRKNSYEYSVLNDNEFHEVQDILKKKLKQLKSIGKGNRPNAVDPLSDEDIATFYSCGVVGIDSPRVLLNALLNNCIYFGMRRGKEQRDLCWADLQLKTDS